MELTDFKEKVVQKFCEELTDKVFLMIQEDKELMLNYLHLIEETPLNYINSEIAKGLKDKFNLINAGKNNEPKSILIQSYEKFKMKTD